MTARRPLRRKRVRGSLAALACAFALAAGAEQGALEAGIALLESGSPAEALPHFVEAGRRDPRDPAPYYYAGAALNRLGRSSEALTMLDRAAYLFGARPELAAPAALDFERGWALLRVRRYADARQALERYERAEPGRGQTAEFMGRALVGLGEYAAAEERFAEAVRRAPELAETVALARAAAAERRGDADGARRELAALVESAPGSQLSRLLAERLAPATAARGARYGITLGLGAGHNSNAIGISDDQPIAGPLGSESDNFRRFLASGFYAWQAGAWTTTASYSLQADFYDDTDTVNQVDHVAGLQVVRQIDSRLSLGLDLRDRYTRIDGEGLLNEWAVTPTVWWRFSERLLGELSYVYGDGDYLVRPASRALDRDHTTHTLTPGLRIDLPALRSSARVTYAHRWVDAVGSDFEASADGGSLQLDSGLPWRWSSRVYAAYEKRDFDNPNTLSPTGVRRDDDFHYVSVFAQRPLGDVPGLSDRLRVYLQYDYADRDSNIGFYGYHQHVFSAGLLIAL